MTLPNVLPRRNPYLFVTDSNPLKVVDVSPHSDIVDNLHYVYGGNVDSDEVIESSILVFADFDSPQGLQLASEAFAFLVSGASSYYE
jgi:UDP-glucose:glycoprotein glucosyltransferase